MGPSPFLSNCLTSFGLLNYNCWKQNYAAVAILFKKNMFTIFAIVWSKVNRSRNLWLVKKHNIQLWKSTFVLDIRGRLVWLRAWSRCWAGLRALQLSGWQQHILFVPVGWTGWEPGAAAEQVWQSDSWAAGQECVPDRWAGLPTRAHRQATQRASG
jgi:hypothetical protein